MTAAAKLADPDAREMEVCCLLHLYKDPSSRASGNSGSPPVGDWTTQEAQVARSSCLTFNHPFIVYLE